MIAGLTDFLEQRIGEFAQANRSYLTIAVGCTAASHRSVYIASARGAFPQELSAGLTRHDSLQKS